LGCENKPKTRARKLLFLNGFALTGEQTEAKNSFLYACPTGDWLRLQKGTVAAAFAVADVNPISTRREIMFRIEETELSRAIEAARKLHPTVRAVEFGVYTVTGSKPGTVYTVKCYRDPQGFKTIDCTCKTRDGVACKHAMAAVALHLYMALYQEIIRRRARRLNRMPFAI
jgi:SWIM zinc finger